MRGMETKAWHALVAPRLLFKAGANPWRALRNVGARVGPGRLPGEAAPRIAQRCSRGNHRLHRSLSALAGTDKAATTVAIVTDGGAACAMPGTGPSSVPIPSSQAGSGG